MGQGSQTSDTMSQIEILEKFYTAEYKRQM